MIYCLNYHNMWPEICYNLTDGVFFDRRVKMHAGVGFSENPDTVMGGMQAASEALKEAGRSGPCDLVLLFATARHDAPTLREAVASVVGRDVPIIGGASTGAISNTAFGYAGDQIILAAFWLDGSGYNLEIQAELTPGEEEEAGLELGRKLAGRGVRPDSNVLLFYDAINRIDDQVKMIMATPLLRGLEKSLGFLPDLIGAGLQGDYSASPTMQWTGQGTVDHHALALTFSDDVRIDSVIMHGCRPATGYYTVTKADMQTILEINGRPALSFMHELLGPAIPVEDYAFFLIFGINRGDKWGEFDEKSYASRLCLAIDKEREGIVMFEPDMVEGTQFQVMFRSLDLDYMPPRIERLFSGLDGRKPVFALYIDCAGRAAAYSGADLEDAVAVQKTVAGRVPLVGLYTGVEIASVEGVPRGLDWTGVFSLFSVPK
ncbi:hypothetical protein C4J81_13665 [Deltaproteobacteria bacterium Smac51]|nr:hypothetical protein C4J81_13665 [Deltaproteobacteria bacterium Smac51]